MEIDGVENNAALRRMLPNIRDVLASKVASAQHHRVEPGAVGNEIVAHVFDVRMMHNFNPTFP